MHPASVEATEQRLSDTVLAQRVSAGEHDALRVLMRRYNQTLYRTARSILKDEAEAEDAVQEAYLLAYRGMSKFRGEAKLSTWLVRIVINEAIARARKRSRRAEIVQLNGDTEPQAETAETNMNQATPERPDQSMQRAQTRRLLEAKIDELPNAFRTVFVLRALEEMSVEETANCLAIPEATVRTRYFRAKGLLREALAREIDVVFDDAFSFAGERCDRIVEAVLARLGAGTAAGT